MLAILNGPNLNQLGKREPEYYGSTTLAEVENLIRGHADTATELSFFQSNHEGEFIDHIHSLPEKGCKGIIINAGAWTHTSIALRDALISISTPFIEVHLSNIHARETFRHQSYLSDIATGVICGLSSYSYIAALRYFLEDQH